MSDYSDAAITYAYEIERTVEIHLASNRIFRLEVVRAEKGYNGPYYLVRYYERQTLYRASTGTISTEPIEAAIQFHVWVQDVSLPAIHQDMAEAALSQALGFLTAQRNNQNTAW
jgi:hypothetical protein